MHAFVETAGETLAHDGVGDIRWLEAGLQEASNQACRGVIEGLLAMPGLRVPGDERRETAHVIIRRAQLDSASNDIGFVRGKDGRYQAILSDYDRSIGYGNQWLGKVHQHYKESQTLAVAKSKGYIFRGKEVIQTPNGPQIRLQFVAR